MSPSKRPSPSSRPPWMVRLRTHFWQFWQFWLFLTMFYNVDNFGQLWQFLLLTILKNKITFFDKFDNLNFLTILTIFYNFWQFWQFWPFGQLRWQSWRLDTDWKSDNWEPEFMTIFVTWQLRVTLDSIRNSCDVFKLFFILAFTVLFNFVSILDWMMRGWSCLSHLCIILMGHSDIVQVIVFSKPSQCSYHISVHTLNRN